MASRSTRRPTSSALRERMAAARSRYDASWAGGLGRELKALDFVNRGTPAHAVEPILTGFVFSFTGVVAAVSSLQMIYERIFGQPPRGWRNLPRGIVWTCALTALLVFDGIVNKPVRHDGETIALDLLGLVVSALFSGGRCTTCSPGASRGGAWSGRH